MGRRIPVRGLIALALLVAPFVSTPASALPSFARGEGTPCGSCHTSGASGIGQRDLLTAIESETTSPVSTVDLLPVAKKQSISASLSLHTTIDNGADNVDHRIPIDRLRFAISPSSAKPLALSGMSGNVKINNFDASIGFFGDAQGNALLSSTSDPRFWYRLGYSPRFGSLGLAVGLFGESASRSIISREQRDGFAQSVGIDAKISGMIADYSFDVTGMYMTSRDPDSAEMVADGDWNNGDGIYASAEVGLSKRFSLTAAYRASNTNSSATSGELDEEQLATIGARLSLSDQTSLASWYTSYLSERSGDYTSDGAFTLLFISNF